MKLYWAELLDASSPLTLRRWGLLQLCGLSLAFQLLHLTLAWLLLPPLPGLPTWVIWGMCAFFGVVLLGVLLLKGRPDTKRRLLEPVRQAFLDALWLGVAFLAAIFASRMGFGFGVVVFMAVGLVGYGVAFARLWFGLGKP